ncbi:Ankyrin repeat protein [Ceratobasidium theobromae]|uniref:Ankyrin repeat protein n=1 Tax=Ceratobasidium theobromae TaxID=1582974 RepID=A0A5N5QVL2_9AGAM|nr:Ankyrin repeat protein [Ceratobasidium theobromae]
MLLVPTVILEGALSYPICTTAVLDALERMAPFAGMSPVLLKSIRVTPGRWLFRNLQTQPRPARRRRPGTGPRSTPGTPALPSPSSSLLSTHSGTNPLGFLQAVASRYTLWFTARGSAFALSMCVRAGPAQYPLLQFLLQSGANPAAQSCLPLQIAATIGDMHALKVMIEPGEDVQEGKFKGGKRRRIEDRVQPTPKVLSAAMKAKHIQVAKWLVNEKGVVPDMATIQMLQHV